MFRSLVVWRIAPLLLTVSLLAGCADKNAPDVAKTEGAAAKRDVAKGDVASDTGGKTVAWGTDSSSAIAFAKLPPQGQREPDLPGELPKRSRKDSVALASMTRGDSVLDKLWPVKMSTPLPGALLPGKRIVAYYGNPLEKRMGALGEFPKDVMLGMLQKEAARWEKADPAHPVVPALHMVVTTAQGAPGKNGLYRLRMRDSLVNEVHSWAKSIKGIFFVDVQLGKDNVQNEIPRLRAFLENPDVHLALDPEFAMAASGAIPGKRIGSMDAKEINWTINFLDEIVRAKKLPPKVLVIHRFTRKMVTNSQDIRPTPNVQVVMDMDGWGPPWLKFDSYHDYVKKEPVQFTGFKLFYHNDTKKGDPLLTPAEVLRLNPRPMYIQYQ